MKRERISVSLVRKRKIILYTFKIFTQDKIVKKQLDVIVLLQGTDFPSVDRCNLISMTRQVINVFTIFSSIT